tara:strand:+ start:1916 stop:2131 length:216 start_codon:yes stop_codon:yes gene_type:complete
MSDSARYNAELAVKSMSTGDLRVAVREIDDSVPSANARSRHKQRTRRDVYQAELDGRAGCLFDVSPDTLPR